MISPLIASSLPLLFSSLLFCSKAKVKNSDVSSKKPSDTDTPSEAPVKAAEPVAQVHPSKEQPVTSSKEPVAPSAEEVKAAKKSAKSSKSAKSAKVKVEVPDVPVEVTQKTRGDSDPSSNSNPDRKVDEKNKADNKETSHKSHKSAKKSAAKSAAKSKATSGVDMDTSGKTMMVSKMVEDPADVQMNPGYECVEFP